MKERKTLIKKDKPMLSPDERHKKIKAIKAIALIVVLLSLLSVVGYFIIRAILIGENGFGDLIKSAEEHPFITSAVLFVINFTQVVIAFIPGEIVEQACGVLGPYLGTLVCLVSTATGSCFVIFMVRKFGRGLLYTLCPKEKIDSVSVLNDTGKRNALTFTLFLIPGTPKDALTYAIGITDMSIPSYIALTSVARLPSIIMSTVSGSWLADLAAGDGSVMRILILNGASIALCGAGYLVYTLINKHHQKKTKENSHEEKADDRHPGAC